MSRKKTNKIEAETGEVVQSNKPFIIRNGGIAKPLGYGLYLLGGKTHEQGGIDIDFTGDARIFSAQPILNGSSPAELVTRGANPNQTFIRQELFKDINGINDDGSKKAKCGKRIKAENGTETEQETPTREEYITSKIDSVRANALNTMLTRERGVQPILKIEYGNDIETRRKRSQELVDIADYMQSRALIYANEGNMDNAKTFRREAIRYYDKAEQALTHCENDTVFGPGCIYTATDAYGKQHRVSGNETFKANPQIYGFIQVDTKERQPGDLQQAVGNYRNNPVHMMMFDKYDENGKPIYVYNDGSGDMKHGKYPIDEEFRIDTYRFVGTPADSVRWTNEYNKLYMNNSNKKRLGGSTGLIRVQANGKDRLMFVPFTGEETKTGRKKAIFGTTNNNGEPVDYASLDHYLDVYSKKLKNYSITDPSKLTDVQIADIDWMYDRLNNTIVNPFSADTDPTISIPNGLKHQENKILLDIEQTKANPDLAEIPVGKYSDLLKHRRTDIPVTTDKQVRQQTRAALKKEGLDWINRNKDWAVPALSALGNGLAGLLSYKINKNALGNMKYVDKPIPKRSNPLITKVNVEPKLTNLKENLARSIESTIANASSSRVSQSRINEMALNTTLAMNEIYTDKENRETALINQDRLNQQEVANANIDAYNNWIATKNAFENTIREKQSENAVALADSTNKALQGVISEEEKRRQFRNNLAVMSAAYPNVTPELLRSYGIDFLRMGGKVKLNKKK